MYTTITNHRSSSVGVFVYLITKSVADYRRFKENNRGLDPTLRLVDKSIEKVQAPLDTVAKYSKTFDKVHDKTSAAIGKVTDFANDKLDSLKQTIKTGVNPEEDLPVQVQEVEKETTNG